MLSIPARWESVLPAAQPSMTKHRHGSVLELAMACFATPFLFRLLMARLSHHIVPGIQQYPENSRPHASICHLTSTQITTH